MPRVAQTLDMKCPICNKGDLLFVLDQDLGPKEPDVILEIRCVQMNTATPTKCRIQTGGRVFNMLVSIYHLGVHHRENIEKIERYTRKLHIQYAAEVQNMFHHVYAEIKDFKT